MKLIIILLSFAVILTGQSLYAIVESVANETPSSKPIVRYYYEGYFNKETKQWLFSQPKSIMRVKKTTHVESKPVFHHDETFYMIKYSGAGEVTQVLRVNYWLRRKGNYDDPLAVYYVDHFDRDGNIYKRVTYYHNFLEDNIRTIEYFDGSGNISKVENFEKVIEPADEKNKESKSKFDCGCGE